MARWPSDPQLAVERFEHHSRGVVVRVSELRMGSHTGTHVDAPVHFSAGEMTVDAIPLGMLIGPAEVYDLRGAVAIGREELAGVGAGRCPRALLKTDNSRWVRRGPMPEVWAHLTEEGARFLVEAGVGLVGVDGLSVDRRGEAGAHLTLLRAGVMVVETLDLSGAEPGEYELVCLPLRIGGGDAAPARAVLGRTRGRA